MTEETPFQHKPQPPRTPPAPPASGPAEPQGPTSLVEYLRRRMEVMERELRMERDRTREAEELLRTQDATRSEVDSQLKSLLDQMKQEKQLRENEETKSHARGRIDALETRLDEMHRTWADLLRQAIDKREADGAETKTKLEQFQKEFTTELPKTVKRAEESERALTENIQNIASRLTHTVEDRLNEIERRLSIEGEKNQERSETVSKERSMMEHALEEERHRLRQEYVKQQISSQAGLDERFSDMSKSLAKLAAAQEDGNRQGAVLKDVTDKLHEILTRPETAKDQIVLELEQEKRDLIKALKDRTEQLRAYTMERREVERSLGESLMELNRQLENERAKQHGYENQISDLKLQARSFQEDMELKKKAMEGIQARFDALSAERDELVKVLMEEAEKAKSAIAGKAESEKVLEERRAQEHQRLSEEREKRLTVEAQVAELKAQLQTLTDHIARTVREKERVDSQSTAWQKEREELVAALRKKDDMISMLSSTFQNMLKK